MRLPRLSNRRPVRSAGEPRSRHCRATAWAASLACSRRKQRGIENWRVLTVVNLTPVDHLADIEAVLEQIRERPHAKPPTADGAAGRQPSQLAADSLAIEVQCQRAHGAKLQIARKDRANRLGFGWDHNDLLVHRRIAERDRAADAKALALGGRDLVAHALSDQFPL